MERLGVFGGTFDPPHYSHLILAEEARAQLGLARVLWLPAGRSPFKQYRDITPVDVRLQMVSVAIADNPAFGISQVDIQREPPHYSADTIRLLQAEYPRAMLFWIMGEDSLRDLPRWHRAEEFVRSCELAVLGRPGVEADISEVEQALPAVNGRIHWVHAPQMEISSKDIRERIRAGRPVRYLLPPAVRAIIRAQRLYASGGRSL